MVVNVEVEVITDISVRVSWDLLDIPETTGYIVYYSQTGSTWSVTTSANSVTIGGLTNDVEYQFQVAAIAELDGDVVTGERSILNDMSKIVVPTPLLQGNYA